jgi:hypothetical protein
MLSNQPINCTGNSSHTDHRTTPFSRMLFSLRNTSLLVVYYIFIVPIMLVVLLNSKESNEFDHRDEY